MGDVRERPQANRRLSRAEVAQLQSQAHPYPKRRSNLRSGSALKACRRWSYDPRVLDVTASSARSEHIVVWLGWEGRYVAGLSSALALIRQFQLPLVVDRS